MLESSHFTFNGVSSRDMGVKMISTSNGLYSENFLPNRTVVETKGVENPVPFFQRVSEDSFTFSVGLLLEDWDKRNNLRSVARWLYQPYYKPLILETNPDVIIYAMFVGDSKLLHNGVQQGYLTVNVKSKSPYLYSIPHTLKFNVNGYSEKRIYNNGDKDLKFNMKIKNNQRGNIVITNVDDNETFLLTDIYNDETVYVNSKNEYIVSSLEERLRRYLADNHNDVYISIPPESENLIIFDGNFEIELEYQYEYLAFDNEIGR